MTDLMHVLHRPVEPTLPILQNKPVINIILALIGEASEPPELSSTRGPLVWDEYDQDIHVNENGLSISE